VALRRIWVAVGAIAVLSAVHTSIVDSGDESVGSGSSARDRGNSHRSRRGPVVLAAPEDETSRAAETFARRVADRAHVELHVGPTTSGSARIARDLDATLVVVPAMSHRWVPRGGSAQSASRLVARTGCPVASVSPALAARPRTCIAAVDFSVASGRAVRLALLVLDDCGTLTLIYVAPLLDLSRP
jgi:hypothetical protein